MDHEFLSIVEKLAILEGRIAPKDNVIAETSTKQKKPALFNNLNRDESAIPMVGGVEFAEEKSTDVLSQVKASLADYLKSAEDNIKQDKDLIAKKKQDLDLKKKELKDLELQAKAHEATDEAYDMDQVRRDAEAGVKASLDKASNDRISALKNPPKEKGFMAQVGDKIIGGVKGAAKGFMGVDEEFTGNVKDTELKNVDPENHGQGEGDFVKNQLHTIKRVATHLNHAIGKGEDLPDWVQSEIAQATDKIVGVMDYSISSKEQDIDQHTGDSALMREQDLEENSELEIGDPIIVTAPNEYDGMTGEIIGFGRGKAFVMVQLYNHDEVVSMHSSDVEYNQYADDEDADEYGDYEDEVLDEEPNQTPAGGEGVANDTDPTYAQGGNNTYAESMTAPVKTMNVPLDEMGGSVLVEIHGDERDGFCIKRAGKEMATRFASLEEAEMALEMYNAHRAKMMTANQSADYIEEK